MGEHDNTLTLLVVALAAAVLGAILYRAARRQASNMTEEERAELERQVDEDIRTW